MNLLETLEWQRCNNHDINRLAKLGDKLAKRLIEAYRVLYADKLNIFKQDEWLKICDDFARRALTQSTRVILQDRFGFKPPTALRRVDS